MFSEVLDHAWWKWKLRTLYHGLVLAPSTTYTSTTSTVHHNHTGSMLGVWRSVVVLVEEVKGHGFSHQSLNNLLLK